MKKHHIDRISVLIMSLSARNKSPRGKGRRGGCLFLKVLQKKKGRRKSEQSGFDNSPDSQTRECCISIKPAQEKFNTFRHKSLFKHLPLILSPKLSLHYISKYNITKYLYNQTSAKS